MPSATAIRGFAERTGQGATFDVTVSGKVDGKELTGWARVRQTSPGVWSARILGEPESPLGEAVSSVLEARRVTHALRNAGDLVQRHRKRAAPSARACRQ